MFWYTKQFRGGILCLRGGVLCLRGSEADYAVGRSGGYYVKDPDCR
jgi:hypothetical protein